MVVTVSARYARVGSFYRYAATHWGRFTATRPLTWGILPLRGHSLGGSLATAQVREVQIEEMRYNLY